MAFAVLFDQNKVTFHCLLTWE